MRVLSTRSGARSLRTYLGVDTTRRAAVPVVLAAAVVIPFLSSGFMTSQLSLALIYVTASLALNLVTGFNGQMSVGHGALMAVGAFTAALISRQNTLPYLVAVPVAAVAAFAVGVLLGLPAARLKGMYLAVVTLAFAVAVPEVIKRFDVLGGVSGLVVRRPSVPFDWPLSVDQYLYFLSLATVVLVFVVCHRLTTGQVGRAIVAVRENEMVASTFGVPVARLKVIVFAYSASMAGIAGVLYAYLVGFVSADSFPLFLSINLLVGIVVGGMGSLWGSVIGGLFITFAPIYASELSNAAPDVVFGAVLILALYFFPTGIASARPLALRTRWPRRRGEEQQDGFRAESHLV